MAQPLIISNGEVQVAPTSESVAFGDVTIDNGGTTSVLILDNGSTAAEGAGTGRIRYNEGTNKLQISENAGGWANIATGSGSAPFSDIVEANGDITTTSTSYILATGMTITPAAGTYLVWFSGVLSVSGNSNSMLATIYSGGTQVSGSERALQRGGSQGDVHTGFCCVARVTVNGSQAIEGRWRVSSGTGTMQNGRTLAIVEVTT